MGCPDAEPTALVNLPGPHLVCAVHTAFVSNALPVGALARKKPLLHAVHCVSWVGVPAAAVHSPCEQVLWIPEHALASDASLALSFGGFALNLPLLHVLHCVSDVAVPADVVHWPAEQVLYAAHTDASCSAVLAVGAEARNRPVLQALHFVSNVPVPAACVHSPRLHVACTMHASVLVLVVDPVPLKNPPLQDSHTG